MSNIRSRSVIENNENYKTGVYREWQLRNMSYQ